MAVHAALSSSGLTEKPVQVFHTTIKLQKLLKSFFSKKITLTANGKTVESKIENVCEDTPEFTTLFTKVNLHMAKLILF